MSKMSYDFTVCNIFTYEHQKHTDSKRQLSIVHAGCCDFHEWNDTYLVFIHKFADLKE